MRVYKGCPLQSAKFVTMIRILCTGDLHLGRRPGGMPGRVDDPSSFSPIAVWSDFVETAIAYHVDLVLLSGDVIDQDNRFFEAFGPLEAGIHTLLDQGIDVLCVAGNHDHDSLSRFSRGFGQPVRNAADKGVFRLLGQGGVWERYSYVRDGRVVLHVDGWSFPSERYTLDPLDGYDLASHGSQGDVPVVGLLHCDLDQPGSPYAPVSSVALRRLPVCFWLLGHIHKPMLDESSGESPILYPGSLQALDPSETGLHGPWLVELSPSGRVQARHIPLARLRYENVEIDVSGAQTVNDVEATFISSLKDHFSNMLERDGRHLRLLLNRVTLRGNTAAHRHIEAHLSQVVSDLQLSDEQAKCMVTRVDVQTRPDRNLQEIARGRGAPAVLARTLLVLMGEEPSDPATDALVQKARRRILDIQGSRTYIGLTQSKRESGLGDLTENEDLTKQWLLQQGLRILDEMLAQKEGA